MEDSLRVTKASLLLEGFGVLFYHWQCLLVSSPCDSRTGSCGISVDVWIIFFLVTVWRLWKNKNEFIFQGAYNTRLWNSDIAYIGSLRVELRWMGESG